MAKRATNGLGIERVFSTEGVSPFDQVKWDSRKASITDDKGGVIFEQPNVEVPRSWSMLATNVVASKYFYGDVTNGTDPKKGGREYSVKQMIHRVSRTIADWGVRDGYFSGKKEGETFYNELTWLLVNQYGAFNSPVWFNCGIDQEYGQGREKEGGWFVDKNTGKTEKANSHYERPQCSACFIQHVDDTMESIMDLARSEAMLFKYGSGSGTDLSTIRSSKETLSGGGKPSGPLSFLKVYDAVASVVKSGGKTRRAAKMNTLKDWHPDIKEFIEAKSHEEKKAWALIEQGYAGDFNGEAYGSVAFQNENLSVRVSDEFMRAVIEDRDWTTHHVTDETKAGPTYKARDLMKWMAEGAHLCGDPGVQYEDTIQRWHTCKTSGKINSSNPCSEYMFLDNTACNLASLNLQKFSGLAGKFDVEKYKRAVDIFITAQEIIVDNASYPTPEIAEMTHLYRTLGLGYANLGGLLMSLGLSYDSDEGRNMAAALTAIMHNEAYVQSAKIAKKVGVFKEYEKNKGDMLAVVKQHRDAVRNLKRTKGLEGLVDAAEKTADEAVELGEKYGYRNAQTTVLAPTGTIGFLMDADTTGVEPDIALVKYKLLAGGGNLKIVNRTVGPALERLGYNPEQVERIRKYIGEKDTIEGAPDLKEEHLPIFDCAFKPRNGERYLTPLAHMKMMAAVQPFLSGAISKTVNMPNETTVDEIMGTYIDGWKMGLKALAVYRDGCKRSQPVSTGKRGDEKASKPKDIETVTTEAAKEVRGPLRRRMPATRNGIVHKFDIAGHEGYLTAGLYDDGRPGELFITMAKEGSTIGGLMDAFGTAISMCLQYGVPVKSLVDKFVHSRFEPSGFTKNPDIPIAKSIPDYIFRWVATEFLDGYGAPSSPKPIAVNGDAPEGTTPEQLNLQTGKDEKIKDEEPKQTFQNETDAPPCPNCGHIATRNGHCHRCDNCGESLGCS